MSVRYVKDAWELYQLMVLASAKKQSRVTEEGRWKNYLAPVVGDMLIEQITKLEYYKIRRFAEINNLSPQTVKHCLSLLQRIINKAVDLEVYNGNIPSFKGVFPKFDNRRVRFLNKEEMQLLLKCLSHSKNWHDIALFAVNTGLRKSEIFKITLDNIDFTNRVLHVTDTKSKINRSIPLNNPAYYIVKKNNHLAGESVYSQTLLQKRLVEQ